MSKKPYDPAFIERKWQRYWDEHASFISREDPDKEKYYVLTMFPYPSGAGLHVGHVSGYTGTDAIARYKRQKGFSVLHPMGWDSFGLPAEQYAIKTGVHPRETTEKNIETYRTQLKSLGFSYDWSREFATSSPDYYKWTQWLFTRLFEKGLAYQAEVPVNFCPHLGTVLANEEVEDGKSVEGGYPVEKRPLRQWMLRITEYADRLLEDLELVDWPESLKKIQRNWIGKSCGVDIHFSIKGFSEKLTCFTTRHDTLFGVTFLVISPEHPLLSEIVTPEQKGEVTAYCAAAREKEDLQRTDLAKERTGAFSGAYAEHPITKEKLPIWVADYVLMGYGTGAVMGVPAHDARDNDFATHYQIHIQPVVDENGNYINSTHGDLSLDGLSMEDAKETVAQYLEKENIAERKTNYKLRDWLFSRQRYWGEPFPILHFEDGSMRSLGMDELPLLPPTLEDFQPSKEGLAPFARVEEWVRVVDPKTKKVAKREINSMPQWAGSCWYYLRFCDPHNKTAPWDKSKERYWMNVDIYIGGVEHAVLHLLYARFWHKVFYDQGMVSTKEPFQRMLNQGLIVAYAYKLPGGGYISPKQVVEKDGQFVDKQSGKTVTRLLEKMSKSKLNGVSPDEMIQEFGADSLRLYVLFMAPFDKERVWDSQAVAGCRRFLNRVFQLVQTDKIKDEPTKDELHLYHGLIRDVEEDYETLGFNTAIAHMMEFLNDYVKLESHSTIVLQGFMQLLSPLAPHFAEECWQMLGGDGLCSDARFPQYEEKYLQEDKTTIIYQVNGKVRGRGEFKSGVDQECVLEQAQKEPNVKRYLDEGIRKVIFIPNKILNIVT